MEDKMCTCRIWVHYGSFRDDYMAEDYDCQLLKPQFITSLQKILSILKIICCVVCTKVCN